MAKRIKNPIEVTIYLENDIIKTLLHYGLECDDGLVMRGGFAPVLTPAEQTAINGIVTNAINKIKEHEGIT